MRTSPLLVVAATFTLSVAPASPAPATAAPRGAGGLLPAGRGDHRLRHGPLCRPRHAAGGDCPARRDRWFSLTLFLSREDGHGGQGLGLVVMCDPPSAPDSGTCEVDLTMDHPPVETARYDVAVTYPGVDGDETLEGVFACVSLGATASCLEDR